MLESIHLKNVGPAPEMKMDLAPRLNLITGDNGLGKSFLLDVAWWALTGTWADYQVRPSLETVTAKKNATIAFSFEGKRKQRSFESRWVPRAQEWTSGPRRPADPSLVIYARVDGGFAVWDSVRNQKAREVLQEKGASDAFPKLYVFNRTQVWDGLPGAGTSMLCNGLIRDWVFWQALESNPEMMRQDSGNFRLLRKVLEAMSEQGDHLEPGTKRVRVSINDARDYPTIRTAYGEEVALVLASAAVRRIAALAYLLVWTWLEHTQTSAELGLDPTKRIVFLIDEVESHLHPRWQRTIVPSLIAVVNALAPEAETQLLISTHAPLVMASAEPFFDVDKDAWFDLDLENKDVVLRKRPYVRRGEIGNWLASQAFDLKVPRSLEGERAVLTAQEVLSTDKPTWAAIQAADRQLREAGLPDIDKFWVRWGYFVEQHVPKSTGSPKGAARLTKRNGRKL